MDATARPGYAETTKTKGGNCNGIQFHYHAPAAAPVSGHLGRAHLSADPLIRALRKYLRGGEARREKAETRRTLGEVLKAHRMRCQMTQEFVAEALGVSRQAVSKWETGTADPSTSNLLALAKLFGVPAEELLHQATGGGV